MPDGLHLSDEDFYKAEITAAQYLTRLEAYLERLLSFDAIDEDTARSWFQLALTTLQYKDYATYESTVEKDTRIINPSDVSRVLKPGEEPERFVQWLPWQKPPEYTAAMPEGFSSKQLPLFKQVIAPTVYQSEAARLGVQYGYVDEKGNVLNESAYNTLLRKGMQDAEDAQLSYINDWLTYNVEMAEAAAVQEKDTALAAKERARAEKLRANQWEVIKFMSAQAQERADVAGVERREIERKESWAKEAALRERPGEFEPTTPAIPTGVGVVQEFLEEGRPTGLQEFIKGKLPSVLEQFEREQTGARRAWWSALQRPARESYEERLASAEAAVEEQAGIITAGAERGMKPIFTKTQFEQTPGEWRVTKAPERWEEAKAELARLQERGEVSRERRPPAGEDPLATYLAQYPWSAEFMKLSPSQRGFQPSRYAPAARWFT